MKFLMALAFPLLFSAPMPAPAKALSVQGGPSCCGPCDPRECPHCPPECCTDCCAPKSCTR